MFLDDAWQDYLYWQRCDPASTKGARERATRQKIDKKILRRVNQLIKDIQRSPFEGLGKPEPLKFDMSGARIERFASRREARRSARMRCVTSH